MYDVETTRTNEVSALLVRTICCGSNAKFSQNEESAYIKTLRFYVQAIFNQLYPLFTRDSFMRFRIGFMSVNFLIKRTNFSLFEIAVQISLLHPNLIFDRFRRSLHETNSKPKRRYCSRFSRIVCPFVYLFSRPSLTRIFNCTFRSKPLPSSLSASSLFLVPSHARTQWL